MERCGYRMGNGRKSHLRRAYYKNARLVVLDEPASALDAHAEYEVYRQFSEMSAGKTVLLISHRLGSARMADRIIYLNNGGILELYHPTRVPSHLMASGNMK